MKISSKMSHSVDETSGSTAPHWILAEGEKNKRLVAKCKCLLPEAIAEIILGCKLQDKQRGFFWLYRYDLTSHWVYTCLESDPSSLATGETECSDIISFSVPFSFIPSPLSFLPPCHRLAPPPQFAMQTTRARAWVVTLPSRTLAWPSLPCFKSPRATTGTASWRYKKKELQHTHTHTQ